ncbi:class I SAM-dependent methyltransferase [Micromonospora sp. WMMD1102]|uniref:class I SAM-dependent methyltransferase n=1 Tax=Micromonospora sp. WMMD1102 TaxID=3016105 RepID=UPI0024152D35|nr:class I SAM-dependent methyltransferase [Micromonospora sp. WMMD1102]MDG4786198.1 class I SAM-dependent methyltransferase [Micromonospora sp. WMMD1102]
MPDDPRVRGGTGPPSFRWDETLYAGSADHYAVGRMPYPAEVADTLAAELRLDGRGRLLDVGCGPGSLTLLLAPLFEAVVGLDADRDMLRRAGQAARETGVGNVRWQRLRAEELPAGLGTFRVVTFAQSFHWLDRPRVARAVRPMLGGGGVWVHVGATTHRGVDGVDPLPFPRPPHDGIAALVARYLGPVRRAGRGTLPSGTAGGEEEVMWAAGYHGPHRLTVGGGMVRERTEDEVVAGVFSLSSSAPHLFADRLPEFEGELRRVLRTASPGGRFAERTREIELVLWRP